LRDIYIYIYIYIYIEFIRKWRNLPVDGVSA